MVLDKLSESLKNSIKKIIGAAIVDEKLVEEIIKDIQRALLQADVDVKLVFELCNKIRKDIKESKKGFSKKEQIIKVIYDNLVAFLGTGAEIDTKKLLVGLFGCGKTTTAGKLALYYKKRGFKVALIGLDTFRPAAMEQLEQIAKSIHVPVFLKKGEKRPAL